MAVVPASPPAAFGAQSRAATGRDVTIFAIINKFGIGRREIRVTQVRISRLQEDLIDLDHLDHRKPVFSADFLQHAMNVVFNGLFRKV